MAHESDVATVGEAVPASSRGLSARTADVRAEARLYVVGSTRNETNVRLAARWSERGTDAALVSAAEAERAARPGDVVIGRLDVLPTLDGVEPGLLSLRRLEHRGLRVLNRAEPLLAVHDKLRTALRLQAAGLPHPRTTSLRSGEAPPGLEWPLVLKPRFGSWGRDVVLCRDRAELERRLRSLSGRPWFRRHGAILQELVPPQGHDLRVIVAGGKVVGASQRVAAVGDWRTNVSLGGSLRAADAPPAARALARAAAAAVGIDLAGVDLLPLEDGGYVVLELNGAVDFDERYSLGGLDLYQEVARALSLPLERKLIRRG